MQMIFMDVRCPRNSMCDDWHPKIGIRKCDTKKLMPNLSDKEKCAVQYRALGWCFTPGLKIKNEHTLREKCTYLSIFSPNAGKYGPEKLQIRTLFMQWSTSHPLSKNQFTNWKFNWRFFRLMEKETNKSRKNQENQDQYPNLFEATQFAWIMEFMKLVRTIADTTFSI